MDPSQKINDTLIIPNISIFYQYRTMMMLIQKTYWMHILPHLIARVEQIKTLI
jgi:hypothetical protein